MLRERLIRTSSNSAILVDRRHLSSLKLRKRVELLKRLSSLCNSGFLQTELLEDPGRVKSDKLPDRFFGRSRDDPARGAWLPPWTTQPAAASGYMISR